jgi:UDP-N-acetylmuramoyl-L-alanyl-D-glutamate--2,6-diaminopimelate ligase
MRLKDLWEVKEPFIDIEIPALWDDSRRVTPGSLFAALPPVSKVTKDGKVFIDDALAKGAAVVILDQGALTDLPLKYPQVCFVPVADPRAAFRKVVGRFYGQFSKKVRVLGVTGTNGKTTITYFLESIIKAAGKRSGVVGTVNYRVGEKILPSKNTTPGFLDNQIFLANLAADVVDYAVMEVSSHALVQRRVDLINFCGAIFTNLTGDHLDEHGDMENYFKAKALLFTALSPNAWAVVNVDDLYGQRLKAMTRARVITYAINAPADVTAHIQDFNLEGTRFKIRFFGQEIELQTHFIGRHNLYNILAAFAAGLGEGIDPDVIRQGIASLVLVPGRLERVECGKDFCVFIDYAHTDDGLKNVLGCLKAVPHNKLIVVFGCGGDRDSTKRPRMGRVACEFADHAVITSDNPRREDPLAIIAEIVPGFTHKNYEIEPDREKAIERALSLAGKGDIVLLAGKGHETYQVLKDRTIDCVERDIVMRILKR